MAFRTSLTAAVAVVLATSGCNTNKEQSGEKGRTLMKADVKESKQIEPQKKATYKEDGKK